MSTPFSGLLRLDLRLDPRPDPRPDLRPPETEAHSLWRQRCRRDAGLAGPADDAAREIIAAVDAEGDAAVIRFTQMFEDRTLPLPSFDVPEAVRVRARERVPPPLRAALESAAFRIREFHATQIPASTGLDTGGASLRSRATPLRRVAVYAPGGTAAYPSSVLMAAIPAKVAGVPEVILLTPRTADVVLVAADIAGVDRVLAVGGAQAIAAAALGTVNVPRVDKIVGPGNAYVTAAKRQVFGRCDIDCIAGPSEILIVADASADPAIIAADLLSQAEHDPLAAAVLITDAPQLLPAVDAALLESLVTLPRRDIASQALRKQGAAVLVADRDTALREANAYAPEHLELLVERPREAAERIHAAGAIFVGPHTPEAAGDYTAGPSHVLPTAGAARFNSPLGVWDFIKYTSVLELGADALHAQAETITTLARAEGLEAHARAVEIRLGDRSRPVPRPGGAACSPRWRACPCTTYPRPRPTWRACTPTNAPSPGPST